MGSNRRYADSISRARFNRDAEAAVLQPLSLTQEEIGDAAVRLARAVIPVRVWVVIELTPVRVEGVALRWTDRCVEVAWPGGEGNAVMLGVGVGGHAP